MQQQVIAESVKVRQIEKEQEIEVQEAEILRHERELIADGSQAGGDRKEADQRWPKRRSSASLWKRKAMPPQSELKARPRRRSSSRRARRKPKRWDVKAEAYQEYNQAAVVDKLITSMPEIVGAGGAPGQRRQDHCSFHW